MEPREEIETLQGEARTGERPLTRAEQNALRALATLAKRRAILGRLGCALGPVLFVALLIVLGLVPKESGLAIAVVMLTGFGGLAWLLLAARDARESAKRLRRDAQAGAVERFEIEGRAVEALDLTGRIVPIDDQLLEASYGVRRTVGLPHALLQNDRSVGPRRLSVAECDEIDRLVSLMRRKPHYIEVFTLAILPVMVAGSLLMAQAGRWEPSMLVMPCLFAFAAASNGRARWSLYRVRAALREGKHEGRVVGMLHEGKHFEVLAGKVVWTVDGRPSDLRTRWEP